MRRATAALALAVVGAYAGFASAAPIDHPMPSDWSFTLGAGALLTPSYPGAASTKVVPLPFVDVRYKDRIFLSPIAGLGVNVLAVPGARLGVSLLPDLGRSASQGNRLRGWATSRRVRTSNCSGNCASSARLPFSRACAASSAEATERWSTPG